MIELFAAGKCSDLLIACAKANDYVDKVSLTYYTQDYAHQRVILDVLHSLDFLKHTSRCIISSEPEKDAREAAEAHDGIYITTSLLDNWNVPNFDFNVEEVIRPDYIPQKDYICIQMEAGFGKRTISNKFLKLLDDRLEFLDIKCFNNIIILGSKHIQVNDAIVRNEDNRSGRTFSIVEAMNLINHSVGFIGQEGILAFYSAIIGKPCAINFTENTHAKKKLFRVHRRKVIELRHGSVLNKMTTSQLDKFVVEILKYQKNQ